MKPDTIDAANELRVDQTVASMRIDRNAVSATHCEECGEDIPEPRRHRLAGMPDVRRLPEHRRKA